MKFSVSISSRYKFSQCWWFCSLLKVCPVFLNLFVLPLRCFLPSLLHLLPLPPLSLSSLSFLQLLSWACHYLILTHLSSCFSYIHIFPPGSDHFLLLVLPHLCLVPHHPIFHTPLLLSLSPFISPRFYPECFPSFPPSPMSLWPFPRQLGAEGAGWRGDGWPLRQLIGNSLIYGQALPRPNGFISFCRHMMSQPRSPQQRPPFVVVSVADDLKGIEGWREEGREREREGDEGGNRKGVVRFVCKSIELMYEGVFIKRVAFAEMLYIKFCQTWKIYFYCLSFTPFPKVSFSTSLPYLNFLPLLSFAQ